MIEQIEFRKTYYLPVRVTEFNHEVGDEEPTVRLENLSGRHQLVDFEQNIMNELVEIDLRIDQPKPVVPQFVAEWYEDNKDKLEVELCYQIRLIRESGAETDFEYWLTETENPIQILINMHQFGYTVKLYTVKILGCTLFKMTSDNGTEYKLIGENETPSESKFSSYKFEADLTEQEIKQADERLWQFAKEVTE